MLNEGSTAHSTRALMMTEMIKQLHALGRASADDWERAVFTSLTGYSRDDVDWDVEDNHAGYYTWVKSFDQLANELVEDGFAKATQEDGNAVFQPIDNDPAIDWSRRVYRPAG